MIFTAALQLYCKKYKITMRALAKDSGLSRSAANRFLNGETISSDNFAKLLIWALRPATTEVEPDKDTKNSIKSV